MNPLTLVAVIAACIAVSECTILPLLAISSDCSRDKNRMCIESTLGGYAEHFTSWQDAGSFVQDINNVHELTTALETAKTCLEVQEGNPICQGPDQDLTVDNEVDFALDFLKQPFSDKFVAYCGRAHCIEENTIPKIQRGFYANCVAEFHHSYLQSNGDACPAVAELKDCLVRLVKENYCGSVAARLVEKVWIYGVKTPYGQQWLENNNLPAQVISDC